MKSVEFPTLLVTDRLEINVTKCYASYVNGSKNKKFWEELTMPTCFHRFQLIQ